MTLYNLENVLKGDLQEIIDVLGVAEMTEKLQDLDLDN